MRAGIVRTAKRKLLELHLPLSYQETWHSAMDGERMAVRPEECRPSHSYLIPQSFSFKNQMPTDGQQ
jgi:hypothetical protein